MLAGSRIPPALRDPCCSSETPELSRRRQPAGPRPDGHSFHEVQAVLGSGLFGPESGSSQLIGFMGHQTRPSSSARTTRDPRQLAADAGLPITSTSSTGVPSGSLQNVTFA